MAKNRTPTTIASHTRVDGKIRGDEDLLVLGRTSGAIEIEGLVEVAGSGIVEADVLATRVVIAGVVVGTVVATESLVVESTGRVVGSLTAPTLRIAEGAQYAGRLEVSGDARAADVAATTKVETTSEIALPTPAAPAPAPRKDRPSTTKRIVVKKQKKRDRNGVAAAMH